CRVKFDIDKLNKYYENGDMKKLKSLAYTYCSEVTYLKEDDYKELNLLLITIVEKIFDIEARDVQAAGTMKVYAQGCIRNRYSERRK
ncbi:MAG: hypothetical protein Q4D32_08985, partial [Eubacteriales bacterium]|nr:hypothetical protein [Eubacteriales bacterium]